MKQEANRKGSTLCKFCVTDLVHSHLKDGADSVIIADDSVQDKRHSKFIELVKKQYSGNEHGRVGGINLVNFGHYSGIV